VKQVLRNPKTFLKLDLAGECTAFEDRPNNSIQFVSSWPEFVRHARLFVSALLSITQITGRSRVDSMTQAISHLRSVGLALTDDEAQAEENERVTHRPRARKALYPV
jgi:hypothetical protein